MHEATAKGARLNLNPTHGTSAHIIREGFVRLYSLAAGGRAGLLGGRHDGVCRVLS